MQPNIKLSFRGECGRKVFPITETGEPSVQPSKELSQQSSNTLRTNYSSGFSNETYVSEPRIRRLTPKECERLQGFPDDWTKLGVGDEPISDTQRYKMCGNAVTVNVVEAIMREFKCLNKMKGDK
jgi:site-specific DNA-cytosine methylase